MGEKGKGTVLVRLSLPIRCNDTSMIFKKGFPITGNLATSHRVCPHQAPVVVTFVGGELFEYHTVVRDSCSHEPHESAATDLLGR